MRIVSFPVHDPEYPRNKRIREFLERHDCECLVIDRGHSGSLSTSLPGKLAALAKLVYRSRTADVILLSEMSLPYAWVTWIASRVYKTVHVVDGFIGLYETRVEDWERYPRRSLRAMCMLLLDRFAFWTADIYLTDTEVRAQALRKRKHTDGTIVLSLPVGAPEWATFQPHPPKDASTLNQIRVLFYGHYAPLHGVDTILKAVQQAGAVKPISLTLVGEGVLRPRMEALAQELGISSVCAFVNCVPEHKLKSVIAASDVVLGIFGTSDKASSVIANKVWQGLACGRRVITRSSPALEELRHSVGPLLTEVPAGDPAALALAILEGRATTIRVHPVHLLLEELVEARFNQLLTELRSRSS